LFARTCRRRLFGISARLTQFIRTFAIKPNETEIGMIASLHPLAGRTLTTSAGDPIGPRTLTKKAARQCTAKFQSASSKGRSHK
jgi:hypothetical protein